jgi:hypothetical protein
MTRSRWRPLAVVIIATVMLGITVEAALASASYKGFFGGYCTYYAAMRFDKAAPSPGINWRGNAGTWYKHASVAGWQVTRSARVAVAGTVIVWTDADSGHVGVVRHVDARYVYGREMNWGRFGVVTSFRLPRSNLNRRSYRFAGFVLPMRKKHVTLTTPTLSETTVTVGANVAAQAYLKPGHSSSGAHPVRLLFDRYERGKWVRKFTRSATCTEHASDQDSCRAQVVFSLKGKWRMRAYHPYCASCAAGYSSWTRFTVE